jgi:hypothetical protein
MQSSVAVEARERPFMIKVQQTGTGDSMRFQVSVTNSTTTHHEVTMAAADYQRLARGRTPDQLIEAAFLFLLEREPKESILGRFDVSVIGTYFPEFERQLTNYF